MYKYVLSPGSKTITKIPAAEVLEDPEDLDIWKFREFRIFREAVFDTLAAAEAARSGPKKARKQRKSWQFGALEVGGRIEVPWEHRRLAMNAAQSYKNRARKVYKEAWDFVVLEINGTIYIERTV